MNCKQVQELLPLYVGLDLEEKRVRLVAAHVQNCAECTSSVNEYRETRQLLQLLGPPQLSEDVYAEIRRHVLREIGRQSAAPTLPQLMANILRPRIGWAVATAVLLAVSLFTFYFVANRSDHRQQVAGSQQTADRSKQDLELKAPPPGHKSIASPSSTSTWSTKAGGRNKGANTTIAGSDDRINHSQRRSIPGTAGDRATALEANTLETRSMTAEASAEGNNLAEPDTVDSVRSEKTLRVEMQTKNPNIRIIWFSRQPKGQDLPGESSKGI